MIDFFFATGISNIIDAVKRNVRIYLHVTSCKSPRNLAIIFFHTRCSLVNYRYALSPRKPVNDVRDFTHSKCLGSNLSFPQISVLHYNVVTYIDLFSRVVF